VVEFQPSKLAVVGSNPIARSKLSAFDHGNPVGRTRGQSEEPDCGLIAHVAQLAEHVLGKDEVTRSIRVVGSIAELAQAGRSL
jgi:hypothetical protein